MSDQKLIRSDILANEIIRTRLNVWQFLDWSDILTDHFRKVIIPSGTTADSKTHIHWWIGTTFRTRSTGATTMTLCFPNFQLNQKSRGPQTPGPPASYTYGDPGWNSCVNTAYEVVQHIPNPFSFTAFGRQRPNHFRSQNIKCTDLYLPLCNQHFKCKRLLEYCILSRENL